MNRSCRSPLLYAFLSLAIVLALSACRSPVQGRAEGILSLSLSIPADLSSDVPEPIRRALGEAELACARPRFIHPDGRIVKAVVIKEGGGEVASATALLNAGDTSGTLNILDLPLNEPLTMTVSIYDDQDAKVGEKVVDGLVLTEVKPMAVSIGIVPYDAQVLPLGTRLEEGSSDPVLSLTSVENRLYIFAVELPTRGLYHARMSVNLGPSIETRALRLYDDDGVIVSDYVDDSVDRSGFGLFTNDANGPVRHYLMFNGEASWSGVEVMVHREQESSMALVGRKENDPTGSALIFTSEYYMGWLHPFVPGQYVERAFSIKNLSGKELRIASCSFVGGDASSFSVPMPPAMPIPPGALSEFVLRFAPASVGDYTTSLIVDSEDPNDIDFNQSFSGGASE